MTAFSTLVPDAVLERTAGVHARRIKDEIVMMNEVTNRFYALNAAGTEVWTLLERPMSVADLCHTLQEGFDVEPDLCLRDVSTLLQEMISEELVRIVGP